MIEHAVVEIEPLVGTLPACRVLGASRARSTGGGHRHQRGHRGRGLGR
jgi:hypothetical protein